MDITGRVLDILAYVEINSLEELFDEAREFGPTGGELDEDVWYDHVCQAFMATMMGY